MDNEFTEEQIKLFFDNEKLIYFIMNKKYSTLINLLGKEDLYSTGKIGLIKACKSWNKDKNKFSTYACSCIENEFKTCYRNLYSKDRTEQFNTISLDSIYSCNDNDCEMSFYDLVENPNAIDVNNYIINKEFRKYIVEKCLECKYGINGQSNIYKMAVLVFRDGLDVEQASNKLNFSRQWGGHLIARFIYDCKKKLKDDIDIFNI